MIDRVPSLEVRKVTKTYPGTIALAKFDLTLLEGEVHSFVGTNGSGKSTLIKILAGVVGADPGGTVTIRGEQHEADGLSPAWAAKHGLHFVHQQPSVFDELSVAENLSHGRSFERSRWGAISWSRTERRATATLARFNLDVDPSKPLGALRPAQRMMVAIARALADQDEGAPGVLVLDEPTAALPKTEVSHLLELVRAYAARGGSVLYVSHRLDEVLQVSDRVTVIRDGRLVATTAIAELTHDSLVESMVGATVKHQRRRRSVDDPKRVLSVHGLASGPVRDVTFHVDEGEVVGVAGLLGSGRTRLLRTLFGDIDIERGLVELCGERYEPRSPGAAMKGRVAFVPEDRAADGVFSDQTVAMNLNIANLGRNTRRFGIDPRRERETARSLVKQFGVRTASEGTLISALSGGNQQKVVMARWLALEPKLLLLDEPSQGVDIRARADIHGLVRDAVDRGAGALIVSSDSEELAQYCDRVIVLARGSVAAELDSEELSATDIDQSVFRSQIQR